MSNLSTTRPAGSPTGACPDNCAEAMRMIQDEVNRIGRLEPIARNRQITAAYEKLARDMPENDWVRLASYVSVQGGCAMGETRGNMAALAGWVPGLFNPDTALEALGAANQGIFSSIYPANRMAANCGYEKFLECVESGEVQVPEPIVNAIKEMQGGRTARAATTIAEYEQRIVVQPVYERYASTFRGMSRADGIDRFHDRTSIPIAKTCTRENLVPLDGDISNPAHRVDYYRKLIQEMYRIEGRR